jgi:hypothetical protein
MQFVAPADFTVLIARGIRPGRRRLFAIDGSKALRQGIEAVYGSNNPVQRYRRQNRQRLEPTFLNGLAAVPGPTPFAPSSPTDCELNRRKRVTRRSGLPSVAISFL